MKTFGKKVKDGNNHANDATAPKKSSETAADHGKEKGFSVPSQLKEYIERLDDPGVIHLMPSKWWDGNEVFHERIENYAEEIVREVQNIVDPRTLTNKSLSEINEEIVRLVDLVEDHKRMNLSPKERDAVIHVITDDLLGLGPIQELLENDDISDIMVDGYDEVFIEINGHIEKTDVHFRDENHLLNICQRIANHVGRHVDTSSPICDARLEDGSRVNIILPPLALNGPTITIRKFKKERLTLEKMGELGTLDAKTSALLQILAASHVNLIISGGTGSGKTTLLNCLARYISPTERIITCEDSAELQLQQPQVVSLETRPPNIEGVGQISMRDLVRNCLRMRPDRIVVGEVRGPEAFDLMQAMNTGHEGSMSTLHSNSPRDALFRLENMVAMANLNIPTSAIRQQMESSLDVIVQVQRLRDGTRKVVSVAEISGMEDGNIQLNEIMTYKITGEDENGKLTGEFIFSDVSDHIMEKARYFNLDKDLEKIVKSSRALIPVYS